MIDFSNITILLFDIDNTLLLFDDHEFLRKYVKLIHGFFQEELTSLEEFTNIFLTSTNKMTEKEPSHLDNLSKFALDFESKIGVPRTEIVNRFLLFYQNEFEQVCRMMTPAEGVFPLLTLASKHYSLVAATNPLFPSIANNKRLSISGLDRFSWEEITSAEDYHYTKPHLEFYEELLERIKKNPAECIMVGDDPINDMVAGKLGIKTFLVSSDGRAFADIIKTQPEFLDVEFKADYTGSLRDFYNSLRHFIDSNGL